MEACTPVVCPINLMMHYPGCKIQQTFCTNFPNGSPFTCLSMKKYGMEESCSTVRMLPKGRSIQVPYLPVCFLPHYCHPDDGNDASALLGK